jgi:GAF domain-containing protein
VNDVTQAPDFLPNPLLPDTRSELAVPMLIGDALIGVFDVQSDVAGRFTDADINIQTTLAAQLATSVQNARSYEQARNQAEIETLVNTIGQQIQRAGSVEETLRVAIRELGVALGAPRVSINIQAGIEKNSNN